MKKALFASIVVFIFFGSPAFADRGPIVWHEGVELSQDSQKAIILHNSTEEVLILGTELRANKEVEVLEFIPFPSEPVVSQAKGNPFEEAARLIEAKGIVFRFDNFEVGKGGRGGGGGGTTAPVEIRLSEKIGLHDVTLIKINDIEHFAGWLDGFFKDKGIRVDKGRLDGVYKNARDYLSRGYPYFVFDSVKISEKVRFLEPLTYRFKTQGIYYPLKTSNLIGGTGAVEMILVLPGSLTDDLMFNRIRDIFVFGPGRDIRLSSSAKLQPREVAAIYGPEPFFAHDAKIYLQVFRYQGAYDFKDDFTYAVNRLTPYAYRYAKEGPMFDTTHFAPPLTKSELRDFQEAFCLQDPARDRIYVDRLALGCSGFIPTDEYMVYTELFRQGGLAGIPSRNVVLEANTTRQQYAGKNVDGSIEEAIVKNFNDNNRVAYSLDDLFPGSEKVKIRIRGDKERSDPFAGKGKTYVSRVGFNKERTKALVYVEHIAGPRSGIGYFVILEKQGPGWTRIGFHPGRIY